MRVLHVIPSIAARDGGPSEAVIHLCRALAANGIEVDLAFTMAHGDECVQTIPGVNLIDLPRIGGERFKYAPSFKRRIGNRMADSDLVHIHAIFSHTSVSAARLARSLGRPYILRPLGSLSPYSLQRSPLRKRLFLGLGMRDLIGNAAAIHCTSPSEERDVQAEFDVKRTFALSNGVDEAMFETSFAPRQRTVLFVGRLDRKKNLPTLIEAFACAASPGWRLVIAGEGDSAYETSLRSLTADLDAAVEFVGWVHGECKRELFQTASLFVLPSAHENFGIAVAEAMAAGVPVIVSPQVSLSEIIAKTDSGWVVPADPVSLAAALRDAMANADRSRAKGDNARRTAQRLFRWRQIGDEMLEIYEQTCGHQSVRV